MTALRKSLSSPDQARRIERIEVIADRTYKNLALFARPWHVAAWAALTEGIRVVETSVPPDLYASRNHINAATNMSMMAALIYRFARRYGSEDLFAARRLLWSPRLADELRVAVDASTGYQTFCTVYPYWHADMYAGEALSDSVVRFLSNASPTERRINAYRQGIRPLTTMGRTTTAMPTTPELERLFDRALARARQISKYGVEFSDLRELHEVLYAAHERRTAAMMRRYAEIPIGEYTLNEFRRFYSALNAVAAAHEFLCFLWSRTHGLPIESLVLYLHRFEWVNKLSDLAGLTREQVYQMIRDTTFGRVFAVDFHLLPFVPLTKQNSVLALAPFCSFSSNWEENALRCLSRRDSDLYSTNTLTKEDEMRRPLIALTSATRLITGPHKLTKPAPDIDLLIQDLERRNLVVCELKWIRKPNSAKERQQRDAEVFKGFSQIEVIRRFIESHPGYLYERRYIARPLFEFQQIHYCVVARDHIVEAPSGSVPIYGYDDFVPLLTSTADTARFLRHMEELEWLPEEGTDFGVRLERHAVGRVAVESEVYYPAPGPLVHYR